MKLRWRVYWAVTTSSGTVLLSTARTTRAASIGAYLSEVGDNRDWRWWRRNGVVCQRVAISVRNVH